jgi:hypothetical protein
MLPGGRRADGDHGIAHRGNAGAVIRFLEQPNRFPEDGEVCIASIGRFDAVRDSAVMRQLPRLAFALACVPLLAQEAPANPKPTFLGSGAHRYRWVDDWGRLPDGKELGNTHGCVVVTKAGTILANTDTEHAVIEFHADGRVAQSWGKEFHGGLHGMCLCNEDGTEVLYLAHTRRHEIVKTDRAGKVAWTIGWPEASGIYQREAEYAPTAVAVAPDGRIYAADGYGKSWIHVYDRERRYQKSFGGPGTAAGKFRTPHGLWLDTRGKEPLLLVCDRENSRLQWFTLDGEWVRSLDRDLRRPCNVAPLGDGGLAVADLAGRVTLFDREDRLIGHLGDNPNEALRAQNGVKRTEWRAGEFLSPHGIAVDATGAIYVLDWNHLGRITKLELASAASAPKTSAPSTGK